MEEGPEAVLKKSPPGTETDAQTDRSEALAAIGMAHPRSQRGVHGGHGRRAGSL